jgi:hypothetical protein
MDEDDEAATTAPDLARLESTRSSIGLGGGSGLVGGLGGCGGWFRCSASHRSCFIGKARRGEKCYNVMI